MKIKIEKTEEEITYKNITTTHTFKVNGKEVNVYVYSKYDSIGNDYENDETIKEEDLKALTDLEAECFGENLLDWLDLEVGKSQTEELEELETANK